MCAHRVAMYRVCAMYRTHTGTGSAEVLLKVHRAAVIRVCVCVCVCVCHVCTYRYGQCRGAIEGTGRGEDTSVEQLLGECVTHIYTHTQAHTHTQRPSHRPYSPSTNTNRSTHTHAPAPVRPPP